MDRLTALRLFVRIAESGSITGAGRGLGVSATAASRGLQELEHALGLRLIDRTTRHATATEAGAALRVRLASVLAELDSALGQARRLHDAPAGTLRVVARRSFALRHVLPHLSAFRAAHPAVEIDLTLTEAPSQLPVEGVDLVIRLGAPVEKSFVAHVLAGEQRMLCAAPGYLAAHGTPALPDDLLRHACLGYRREAEPVIWVAEGAMPGQRRLAVAGPLRANSGEALLLAALAGLGIVLLPGWMVGQDLAAGRLVPLLPGWRLAPVGYDAAMVAVHAAAPQVPGKITAFVAHLVAQGI